MPRILTVGTEAVLALGGNEERTAWSVIMPTTTLEAGNTGRVHVGLGTIPGTVIGAPDQSFILTSGDQVGDQKLYAEDLSIFRGQIWLRASAAGQRVWVDEAIGGAGVIG